MVISYWLSDCFSLVAVCRWWRVNSVDSVCVCVCGSGFCRPPMWQCGFFLTKYMLRLTASVSPLNWFIALTMKFYWSERFPSFILSSRWCRCVCVICSCVLACLQRLRHWNGAGIFFVTHHQKHPGSIKRDVFPNASALGCFLVHLNQACSDSLMF